MRSLVALSALAAVAACGDSSPPPMDSSIPDGGPADSGSSDSTIPDSTAPDGAAPDSSASDSSVDDSAVADGGDADAGTPDGGVGTALPFDQPPPAAATGATILRLGNDAFVLVYADNSDASTPAGDELVFQRVVRIGHRLSFEAPERFSQTSIEATSDNPLHLAGSIGDDHFFIIIVLPGYDHVLRYFKFEGGAFVALGSDALGGTDFGDPPAFFHGHPVDDTRHLLGYRESNSGEPVRYRLIVRSGDAFSLGAAVERPPPTSFPGLSTSESQADPALFRVGPTTFVEARPGYVYPPGDMGTWTLEVAADHTLTASNARVHATVDRTMTPEVAADGRGGALVSYHSYTDTSWRFGLYDHATRILTETAVLGTSDAAGIRTHQGESTDRFLGGAYYLRLPGTFGSDAPLFRIDSGDGTTTRLADVPNLQDCYRAPQMVRVGTIAAYTGCDRTSFIDLRPLCGNGTMDADEACDDGNNDDGDGCTAGCLLSP